MARTAVLKRTTTKGGSRKAKGKATKEGSSVEQKKSIIRQKSKKNMTKKEIKTQSKTESKAAVTSASRAKSTNVTAGAKSASLISKEKRTLQTLPLTMRTDLGQDASRAISGALNLLLADIFALFIKTKNFHWHVSGPHFRDYHLLFDDHAEQIFEMVDGVAERVRKVGGTTIRSISHIAQLQRILDNDADYVEPSDMLAELYEDNLSLTKRLREVHEVCDFYSDSATTGLLDGWIDESEQRAWFLFEASRRGDSSGH